MDADEGSSGVHQTVLLHEAIDALMIGAEGFYLDGTFGRGGHSAEILKQLEGAGELLSLDRDPEAVAAGSEQFSSNKRIEIVHSEFSNAYSLVEQRSKLGAVTGMLFDLGVSSPQIDNPERGFSFLRDGALDMRMSSGKGMSAADWVNSADLEEIVRVLKEYGEERFARRIATAIVEQRTESPIVTTGELAALIDQATPVKDPHKHPATRTFQAIRIHINTELDELKQVLSDALRMLAPKGRLVVISFHSLEDRIVKRFMREHSRPKALPRDLPIGDDQIETPPLRLIGKVIKPSAKEISANPRARSAVMRVAERVA